MKSNESKKIFFVKLHFWQLYKLFPSSKIDFWPFLKLQKMEFGQKKLREIDLFVFARVTESITLPGSPEEEASSALSRSASLSSLDFMQDCHALLKTKSHSFKALPTILLLGKKEF